VTCKHVEHLGRGSTGLPIQTITSSFLQKAAVSNLDCEQHPTVSTARITTRISTHTLGAHDHGQSRSWIRNTVQCHSIVYEHTSTICTHSVRSLSVFFPAYNLLMNRRAAKRRRRWGRMYLEKM
jgi:hypothetical protein